MKITNDIENPLLKRRELEISYESEGTPNYATVEKEITEMLKIDAKNLVLKRVNSRFGSKEYRIKAFVYQNQDHKTLIEPKKKIKTGTAAAPAKEK